MIINAYTIYDSKTEAHMRPFYCHTDGEAIRTFSDAVNDPQSPYHKHPHDFTLMACGSFDDTLAAFSNLTAPVNLGGAHTFKIDPE